jgi:hypothetical protein
MHPPQLTHTASLCTSPHALPDAASKHPPPHEPTSQPGVACQPPAHSMHALLRARTCRRLHCIFLQQEQHTSSTFPDYAQGCCCCCCCCSGRGRGWLSCCWRPYPGRQEPLSSSGYTSVNALPRHLPASPSPAYDTSGHTSTPAAASTLPPAASTQRMCSCSTACRAVSGESVAEPGAFLTGAKCSSLATCSAVASW